MGVTGYLKPKLFLFFFGGFGTMRSFVRGVHTNPTPISKRIESRPNTLTNFCKQFESDMGMEDLSGWYKVTLKVCIRSSKLTNSGYP